MSSKIFNPLDSVADLSVEIRAEDSESVSSKVDNSMRSESSFRNEDIGVCPKCHSSMGRAVIANGDEVFYCEKDRVSSPLPNL